MWLGKGLLFGFGISLLIGPIFFFMLEAGIKYGFKRAIHFALGTWISDIIFIISTYLAFSKIQDLIKINSLNLDFKDGRIDTKDLFKLDSSEQLSIYKLFLRELKLYISKIYGKDFFYNIFTEVSEVESKMIDL